jgi:hypothetical protein
VKHLLVVLVAAGASGLGLAGTAVAAPPTAEPASAAACCSKGPYLSFFDCNRVRDRYIRAGYDVRTGCIWEQSSPKDPYRGYYFAYFR